VKFFLTGFLSPVNSGYTIDTKHITITVAFKTGDEIRLEETFSINPSIKYWTLITILRSIWRITEGWGIALEAGKTLTENGIKDNDRLVLDARVFETQDNPCDDDKGEPIYKHMCETVSKKPSVQKRKKSRRSPVLYPSNDIDKVEHSKKLTLVFDEAYGLFQERRQRLNSLVLDKCPAKQKVAKLKSTEEEPLNDDCTMGVGGKAGKAVFPVIVGPEEYLDKSSKSKWSRHAQIAPIQRIDLHGCTREEALRKLNDSLPDWMNVAMKTDHPFSIRVDIISGGGDQMIIADEVEQWIRQSRNVANRF
jgi:DNA-nicking Smr family endonuclease